MSGNRQLVTAIKAGDLAKVKSLFKDPTVNVNLKGEKGMTPFALACLAGEAPVVEFMCQDDRVEVNEALENGCTPLWLACKYRNFMAVKALLGC